MIYLDTSTALAQLLGEQRRPPAELWRETLVSSRLLEYEAWNVINAKKLAGSHGDSVRALLAQVSMVELEPRVLLRAIEPFSVAVRTLDALHLATMVFLRAHDQVPVLASYDERLILGAQKLGFSLYPS